MGRGGKIVVMFRRIFFKINRNLYKLRHNGINGVLRCPKILNHIGALSLGIVTLIRQFLSKNLYN